MKMFDECDFDYTSNGFLEFQKDGLSFAEMDVKKDCEFKKGKYRIVSCHNLFLLEQNIKNVKKYLKKYIKSLLFDLKIRKNATFLLVGLGNVNILADSFGFFVCKKTLATRKLKSEFVKYKLCAICPSVETCTGITTRDIVRGIVNEINVDLVILVDSLLTSNISRLGHSFQLSNVGIVPGGAVGKSDSIDYDTIGVKCLSIGVPFMFDLKKCNNNPNVIVAPKDIKFLIEGCAEILSDVLNSITSKFTPKEIHELLLGV